MTESFADRPARFGHTLGMSSDHFQQGDASHTQGLADIEALEIARAKKLAAMTDEEALELIRSLRPPADLPQRRSDWSALVEQQRIFHGLQAEQ